MASNQLNKSQWVWKSNQLAFLLSCYSYMFVLFVSWRLHVEGCSLHDYVHEIINVFALHLLSLHLQKPLNQSQLEMSDCKNRQENKQLGFKIFLFTNRSIVISCHDKCCRCWLAPCRQSIVERALSVDSITRLDHETDAHFTWHAAGCFFLMDPEWDQNHAHTKNL